MQNKGCCECRYYLSHNSVCLQETQQHGHLMKNGLIGNCDLFIDLKEKPQELMVNQQPTGQDKQT